MTKECIADHPPHNINTGEEQERGILKVFDGMSKIFLGMFWCISEIFLKLSKKRIDYIITLTSNHGMFGDLALHWRWIKTVIGGSGGKIGGVI